MSQVVGPSEIGSGEEQPLEARIRKGLRWSFLNQMVGRLVSVVSGIALARILVPEDFGVFAVALLVVNILLGLNDLGLLLAVVRWPGDLKVAARTAMTLATSFSALLYCAVFAAAPYFADFMNSPESTWVVRVFFLTIVIDGITTVSHGLIVRDFLQDRMAKSEFAAMPVGVAVSIGLALAGAGAWSLAIGQLAGNVVSAVVIIRLAPFRVWPGWDTPAARWMLRFGLPLAMTSVVEYVVLNLDYVIVGRVLGPVALGLYLLAYNVSNWPVSIVTDAVRRVSIAGFAHVSADDEAVRAGFHRTFRILAIVSLPLVLLLAVLSHAVIGALYGPKWSESATVLTYLAILGGTRVAIGYVFDLLIGVGRSRLTLVLKLGWLVALLPALIIGARMGGIEGVGIAHAIVALAVASPLFMLGARAVGVRLGPLGRDLARPLLGTAVAAVLGILLQQVVQGAWLEIFVISPVMIAAYVFIGLPWRDLLGRLRTHRAGQVA